MAIAVLDESHCYMRAVAINNKQLPTIKCFLLRIALKHLL
jgi:hypothetical protein